MDGNFNLVHRAASGHSVRDPLHKGLFFLNQTEVDSFVSRNEKQSEESQVLYISFSLIHWDWVAEWLRCQ